MALSKKNKLTGYDYLSRPALELMSHPDYSPHAMRIMDAIAKMTTKQIENINLIGGLN